MKEQRTRNPTFTDPDPRSTIPRSLAKKRSKSKILATLPSKPLGDPTDPTPYPLLTRENPALARNQGASKSTVSATKQGRLVMRTVIAWGARTMILCMQSQALNHRSRVFQQCATAKRAGALKVTATATTAGHSALSSATASSARIRCLSLPISRRRAI